MKTEEERMKLYMEYAEKTIPGILAYLHSTTDDDWAVDVTLDGNKKCIVNHMIDYFKEGRMDLEIFFSITNADETILYAVNDGKVGQFSGSTPKERCCDFLEQMHKHPIPTRLFVNGFNDGASLIIKDLREHGHDVNELTGKKR